MLTLVSNEVDLVLLKQRLLQQQRAGAGAGASEVQEAMALAQGQRGDGVRGLSLNPAPHPSG